jgi:Spy/CpxP family protein refolding chaperone
MKRILTLALCAVLLLGATVLFAQPGFHGKRGPGGPGGREEFLTRYLDLTDEQQTAAKAIHEQVRTKAEPLMEQQRAQHEEIRALLDGANPDATEIGRKMIASHATGEQIKALHDEALTKISALLNAQQLEKFKKLQEMRDDREGTRSCASDWHTADWHTIGP